MGKKRDRHRKRKQQRERAERAQKIGSAGQPDWSRSCEVCGETPIVPETGMCGPCTFGEAETAGGNW